MAEIPIKSADGGTFTAYHAKPADGGGAGLVLIQEIFGVNRVMRDLADGYAALGYHVLCPDLFWRQEPGVQITDRTDAEWARAFELFKGFDVARGVDDLIATLAAARALAGETGKAGTIGYCLGGKLAYLMATRSDSDANVSYYGVGIEADLEEAKRIRKPLLLHIAEKDDFVPPDAQAQIKVALAAHPKVSLHVYSGQNHAFARVGGKHYDQSSANLANVRTREFLRKHLS